MQIKEQSNKMETNSYRPSAKCLQFFWTFAEGSDDARIEAAIELVKMVQSTEEKSEREKLTTYCVNRLVRGLSSTRQFARVGFSTALTVMLRQQSELKTNQVIDSFNMHLKGGNASTKKEKAALFLGHAFALSSLIQSERLSKVKGEVLESIVDDLLLISNKRSFLKPVCCKAIEDLIPQISEGSFNENVWPKLKTNLILGWENCTLDRISLLLVCRENFPETVNKKFIKKHWGQSLFMEDNDANLLQAIKGSPEKSKALKKILPYMISSGRDALSIWKGIGEKMFLSGKDRVLSGQQIISLEILKELLSFCTDSTQLSSFILDPSVIKAIFKEHRAFGKASNNLVSDACKQIKHLGGDILEFTRKVFDLEGEEEEDSKLGVLKYIKSNNFNKIIDVMEKTEIEQCTNILIEFVKGNDGGKFFSKSDIKQEKQLDWCLRQLQLVCCSQKYTTTNIQHSVLPLFMKCGFFKAKSKNETVLHCDFVNEHLEAEEMRTLCDSFFFKSLGKLSTMNADRISRDKLLTNFMDLLSYLVHYFQSILSCEDLESYSDLSEQTRNLLKKLGDRIKSFEETKNQPSSSTEDKAFQLLYLYMAFLSLTDKKAAKELSEDIFICHDKSKVKETEKNSEEDEEEDEEPHWVDVLTEILLQLLSFQSHLARVISANVFGLIVPHITAETVASITQVLIPNKANQKELFEDVEEDDDMEVDGEKDIKDEDENEEEEEEEEKDLLDDDIPSEEESEGDDDNDNEEEDAESEEEKDEENKIDERLRASVKNALGNAAIDDDEEEDDLPDMSDSEMFKLDEALAEVFRQRPRSMGGKKAKEEKRKELALFRLRVLDLLDVLIKSDRCGEFILDLLKPLLVVMFASDRTEEQEACKRATSSFMLLRKKLKGRKDALHSEEEQKEMFLEIMELAERVKDSTQLHHIALACIIMIKVSSANCIEILQESLKNVIINKRSKPRPAFFIVLKNSDPRVFLPLCTDLIDCLQNDSIKAQSKSLACSLLTSLIQKGNNKKDKSGDVTANDDSWMIKAAKTASKIILTLERNTAKGLFVKEILTLTLRLLKRPDVLSIEHFGMEVKDKLKQIKPKMGTDSRSLTNKIIAALDRLNEVRVQTNGKKRKAEEISSPKAKKKKKTKDS